MTLPARIFVIIVILIGGGLIGAGVAGLLHGNWAALFVLLFGIWLIGVIAQAVKAAEDKPNG